MSFHITTEQPIKIFARATVTYNRYILIPEKLQMCINDFGPIFTCMKPRLRTFDLVYV